MPYADDHAGAGMEDVPVERGEIKVEKSVQLAYRFARH
jgi:hypothetical protein